MRTDTPPVILFCGGGARPEDEHLVSIVHCADDEIHDWLERRERRRHSISCPVSCPVAKETTLTDNQIDIRHLQKPDSDDKDIITVLEAVAAHLILPEEAAAALERLKRKGTTNV